MRLSLSVALFASLTIGIDAFVVKSAVTASVRPVAFASAPKKQQQLQRVSLLKSTSEDATTKTPATNSNRVTKANVCLLTFDLDDTLYPIAPVLDEANAAFSRAVKKFGYDQVQPGDIVQMAKTIREELAGKDPQAAAALTFTESRKLAIRRVMENITFERKLEAVADDWATPVADLSPIVVQNARKWASIEITDLVVQAVYNAWEMERHHSAERHIYPELIEVMNQIKQDHPNVIIGAVTDGKANPLFMTFTIAPYFDFCMSWEDDQAGRTQFFKELNEVEGNAEVKWIYEAALEKYRELASAKNAIMMAKDSGEVQDEEPFTDENLETFPNEDNLWIHVGDDLAYDVGGSAACGAKTVLVELADEYQQTARQRFDDIDKDQPDWSTSSKRELQKRRQMNEAAKSLINVKISYLSRLPEAINDIVKGETD